MHTQQTSNGVKLGKRAGLEFDTVVRHDSNRHISAPAQGDYHLRSLVELITDFK